MFILLMPVCEGCGYGFPPSLMLTGYFLGTKLVGIWQTNLWMDGFLPDIPNIYVCMFGNIQHLLPLQYCKGFFN